METRLSDYITLNRIVFCRGGSRQEVIDELIRASGEDGSVQHPGAFKEALLRREETMTTGIGFGVAIPHVKLPAIETFFVTVGIHKRGVRWDSLDGKPVHLLFLIAGPERMQEQYLRILARITLLIKDPPRLQRLTEFKTKFEVFELLGGY